MANEWEQLLIALAALCAIMLIVLFIFWVFGFIGNSNRRPNKLVSLAIILREVRDFNFILSEYLTGNIDVVEAMRQIREGLIDDRRYLDWEIMRVLNDCKNVYVEIRE